MKKYKLYKNSHQKDTFYLQQMISKFLWLLLLNIFITHSFIQAECDFFEGDISLNADNGNTDTNFSTEYYLTNENDVILQINNTPDFTTLTSGNYMAYSINYETNEGINNNNIGNMISNISGNCFDISEGLIIHICPAECTWFENTYSFNAIGGNNNGFTTQYILTDENGLIEDISDVAFFNNYNDGLHFIYPLNYEDGNTPIDLIVGNSIADITATCIDIGLPLLFKYCPKDYGCDFYTNNEFSLQILNSGNTSPDFTTSYILTDEIGNILDINTTPTFTIDNMGNYQVYGLNYETATGINGLETGENVMNITGNCFDLGTSYSFTVCPTECTWFADTYIFYSKPENENTDFTTIYVLTNENGQIINTNSTSIFTDLAAGNYLIYPINYNSSENINGLTIDENMSAIYGNCLDIGYPLAFKYCPCGPDCDISPSNSFTFNSTNENNDADFTTEFLLVDMNGNIIDKSTTAQFGNIALGQYQIIAINYDNTNTSVPDGLNIGDNLMNIAGECIDFSEPICLNVCDTCEPVYCQPIHTIEINN